MTALTRDARRGSAATQVGRRAPQARLGRRIALVMALGALLLTAALTTLSMRSADRLAGGVFAQGAAQIADLFAASLGGAVKFGKTEILETRLADMAAANGDDVRGAAVFNLESAALSQIGETEAPPEMLRRVLETGVTETSADGLLQVIPVRFGKTDAVVGALAVRWTDAGILAAIRDSALMIAGAGALAALLLAGLGMWGLHRLLSRPLEQLERAVGDLLAGKAREIPGRSRRDEIGALARALTSIDDQRLRAERTRLAVDSSSAMLMIADDSDEIVYVSPGLSRMLRRCTDAVRRQVPDFDADRLVGVNFHVFHRQADRQKSLLSSISASHETEIRLGERRLGLVVSPIRAAEGGRLGTVVEWQDRTEDLAILESIDAAASAAASGDFSQRVSSIGADPKLEQVAEQVNRICETVGAFLSDIEAPVKAMADGDLTRRSGAAFQGRFADVATSVNATLERLGGLVADIKGAEHAMRGLIEQVNGGAGELSSRTEAQASALEETSATVEEISATISNNANGARQASQMAGQARDQAQHGQAVVGDAVASMSEIEESSDRINDITAVIDSIAFQTNLLALNAAVEAARAGEAGKGFAVVASEVRSLAQRSSEAARDIKELIAASGAKVADGVRLVHATGEALGGLMEEIKGMSATIDDIAEASREQATGMQEITSAVSHMDETTQRNAAMAEESARAAQALGAQSDALSELIGFFRTDAAGKKTSRAA